MSTVESIVIYSICNRYLGQRLHKQSVIATNGLGYSESPPHAKEFGVQAGETFSLVTGPIRGDNLMSRSLLIKEKRLIGMF